MQSYNQTLLFLRLLFCVIILFKVISGENYDILNEDDVFTKRSNPIDSPSYFFGRHSRRGRELFGKRSSQIANYWGMLDDQNGFYNKRTKARELLGKRSEIVDDVIQNDKRRARELLGKRMASYFDLSEDILKPQFEKFYEMKRGRTRELFGR